MSSEEIQQIRVLREVVKTELKKTGKKTAFFYFGSLALQKVSVERIELEILMEKITNDSKGNIIGKIKIGSPQMPMTTESALYPPQFLPAQPIGIEIYVKDPNKIDEYFNSLILKSDPIQIDNKADATEIINSNTTPLNKGQKLKPTPTIKIEKGQMFFGIAKIPMEQGQGAMGNLFLKYAHISRDTTLVQKGRAVTISQLQEVSGYESDKSFRGGLKRLRTKLRESGFPVTIELAGRGKYQMVIVYNKT